MSAPPSASAHGTPGPGYYPDPSIPGYIRYWNGAAWVPGTSRPAPPEGEPMPAAPPGAAIVPTQAAPPAQAEPTAPAAREESAREETGPVFLDEEDGSGGDGAAASSTPSGGGALPEVRGRGEVDIRPGDRATARVDPSRPHGGRPEPASAWQADASRQSGFDGERDGRVSWGTPPAGGAPALGAGRAPHALEPGSDPRGGWRRVETGPTGGEEAPPHTEGTVRMRPVRPEGAGAPNAGRQDTVGLRGPVAARPTPPAAPAPAPSAPMPAPAAPMPAPAAPAPVQPAAPAPEQPSWTRQVQELAQRAPAPAPAPNTPTPNIPAPNTSAPNASAPNAAAPNPASPVPARQPAGGTPGGPERVVPWKPPTVDPFLQAAQRQARPAGLGRRLAARLVDGIVVTAVTGAVAFPFVGPSVDHIRGRIEEVEQAGVTRQVWLIDGTTGVYLAIVLAAFLLLGLLYEVLPTARWGRTLGKKLFGLTVLDIEEQDTPSFGAALRRWLVYGPLSLVGVGVVNAFWCVVDKPWRQCWHDKAARTFVAGASE
ncbi:RDD family protein [Streptomyces megasporus]|uniref:RDD family protein n=1 Tax=Streptomyces megasporus TaxID=44060 RepID=UPI0004E0D314|nr:RDD family protein [Streptomyces megasporus]